MALLSISQLQHSFGDRQILDGINLSVDHGEHVGLVGHNGCGKSTLMKMIAGLENLKADAGQIQLARGARAGYLSQHPDLDLNSTLREEAGKAFEELYKLHHQLDQLTHDMQDATGDQLDALLEKYQKLQEKMEAAGGYAVDHKIDATLHGLGLTDNFFNVKVKDLSGGQKGRLALAKLLLTEPDLLLLDEPTNHLDIAGRQWLEGYLAGYRGAVVIISHDRWLLDRVVSKIYEMDRGRLEEYPGGYEKYRALRIERIEFRINEYDKQQDRIKKEQGFIDRYRAGQRATQAQGREKRLTRLIRDESLERPQERGTMQLKLRTKTRSGDMVLSADHIKKGYEGKPLFGPLSLVLRRGDRVGIIGPNGAGKTTFVNCLLDAIKPDEGTVRVGSQVEIGYYRQNQDHLPMEDTVVEYLRRITGVEQSARDLAGAFLFTGLDQEKKLGLMSGGEKARAVLAGLVAGGHNLLVLDEPTNHLDIASAERLEEAMLAYTQELKGFGEQVQGGGSLILITHDRMLLEKLVNQLLILDGAGNIRHFYGKYHEYVEACEKAAAADAAVAAGGKPAAAPAPKPKPVENKPAPQQSQKQPQKSGTGAASKLSQDKLEQKMAKLEGQLAEIDKQLADPGIYRDGGKVKQLQSQREALATELAPLEEEWLRRSNS